MLESMFPFSGMKAAVMQRVKVMKMARFDESVDWGRLGGGGDVCVRDRERERECS